MNDTLYIIGNGFDLHHGLKTSYSSFRDDFAKKKTVLWRLLTDIYGNAVNDDMWWRDFEAMLGKIDYGHLIQTHNGEAMGAMTVQNLLKGALPPFFGGWFKDMNLVTAVDNSLNIDPNALFFTFNYTLTLENVYHVQAENVWHIHGSIRDVDDIIVGHDSDERKLFIEYSAYTDEHEPINFEIADNIMKMAAGGAKGVENRIAKYSEEFSNRYQNVKHIIVMGFSFNDIDIPYIKTILDVNTDADSIDWTIYYHSDGSDKEIINKLTQMGIDMNKINVPIKW